MTDLYTDGNQHQTKAMKLLAEAVPAPRIRPYNSVNPDCEDCIIWGARHLKDMKRFYKRVFVAEVGYFGNRLNYYSLGLGGLNGLAEFNNNDSPPDRWEQYGFPLPDWKTGGDYYLIMGQVPGDMSIMDVNINKFYQMMIMRIGLTTDKPVYFRPHPMARQLQPKGLKIPVLGNMPLDQALDKAAGVITYNSNSGVDAALAGVPVLANDPGSMAWPVSAHTVDDLINFDYPDREQWSYNLAYTQWTAEELKNGTAWGHICNTL